MTVMMVQLVVSNRGVCALPNWAMHEYLEQGYIKALKLGEKGLWSTLYAAIREEQRDMPFMADFLKTAKATCFKTLPQIRRPLPEAEAISG
ncbi:MAG: hypothetical protein B0D91_07070 [Oceanospirillales bacterium LUC14_002_19_P2]|nr:MAG: hypothetical protein B0D91_07070 [Oceanospirillales bacterium LUC14_002_19_P2]